MFKKLPKLHQAVIQNDLNSVREFAHNFAREEVDSLGFNAIEIAKLLGREKCVTLLEPSLQPKSFLIGLKNYNHLLPLHQKQFLTTFGMNYRSHLYFDSYQRIKEVISNCPYVLRFWTKENQMLGEKYKREIWEGGSARLVIRWVNDQVGYGLFADEYLPSGTYVGEYTGRVRRLYRFHHNENPYCLHYPTKFWSLKYFVVDALKEGNELRFVNHSTNPNLQPFSAVDRQLIHQIFLTTRPVKKGDQLVFNYGEDFWRDRQPIETQ
jgi:hypothetical protein